MTDMLDEVRKAVAEISGFDKDWPSHGNAALAITAAYSLLKTDRDTAEQRGYEWGVREAAILCDRRADALDEMGLETMGLETECCVGALINCRDDILILLTQQEQDT